MGYCKGASAETPGPFCIGWGNARLGVVRLRLNRSLCSCESRSPEPRATRLETLGSCFRRSAGGTRGVRSLQRPGLRRSTMTGAISIGQPQESDSAERNHASPAKAGAQLRRTTDGIPPSRNHRDWAPAFAGVACVHSDGSNSGARGAKSAQLVLSLSKGCSSWPEERAVLRQPRIQSGGKRGWVVPN